MVFFCRGLLMASDRVLEISPPPSDIIRRYVRIPSEQIRESDTKPCPGTALRRHSPIVRNYKRYYEPSSLNVTTLQCDSHHESEEKVMTRSHYSDKVAAESTCCKVHPSHYHIRRCRPGTTLRQQSPYGLSPCCIFRS